MEIEEKYIQEIAENLYNIGAIKIGEYRLKSGDLSPYYIDLRVVPSFPSVFKKVIQGYNSQFQTIYGDQRGKIIGGIMSAGIPFATAICLNFDLPLIQIRSEPKKHGTGKLIEGLENLEGKEVLLVDDLISTGVSKIKPKQSIEDLGGKVENLLVFIDRATVQAKEKLNAMGLKVHSCVTIYQLLEALSTSTEVNRKDLSIIKKAIQEWN